jgi:hypothetical protein
MFKNKTQAGRAGFVLPLAVAADADAINRI